MKLKFTLFILYLIAVLWPCASLANLDLITWKGTYYQAIPNKINISQKYCEEHTPGTFIHTVKDAITHPVITDRNISLDHATFHMQLVHGVYFIHGDVLATGKSKNVEWKDHIYFYAYKLTEPGITRGIWSTNDCKGLYIGWVVSNKNKK